MMHWFSGDMPFDKLNAKRSPWSIYGNAKLANMLFSLELKKRLAAHAPGVMAVTCHPGYTSTGLQLTPGKGPAWLMRGMNWAFAQSDNYWAQAKALVTGGGQPQFNGNALVQLKVPLPPLTTQRAIVAEIEAEQALVAANRELIARMEKKIQATLARIWGEPAAS
jgi:hypothetical protein